MIRRILVTGSRTWPGEWAGVVHTALEEQRARLRPADGTLLVVVGYDPDEGYPPGVDRHAYRWACEQQARPAPTRAAVEVEPHPADWTTHPKSAGRIRNAEMVAAGAHLGLAFCLNDSGGTLDCIRKARKARINMIIWHAYTPDADDAGAAGGRQVA